MTELKIRKVKEIVSLATKENGWAEMSAVGLQLLANGIDFKNEGFNKLKPFFESLPEHFAISVDPKSNLPLVKCLNYDRGNSQNASIQNSFYKKEKIVHLTQWASINQKSAIESLKNMALKEDWTYSKEDPEYPNPILAKYLKWTFVRLFIENKILYSNNFASFNTGLVDRFYKPIYAIFDKNKYNLQPWHFIDFCVAGASTPASKFLTDNFSQLPQRAKYIKTTDDILYDTSFPVDVNWAHIILDNIERMPAEFLKQACYGRFEFKDPSKMDDTEKSDYFNTLRKFLESEPVCLAGFSNMMSLALETAKLRVDWNHKTAIPIYYPTDNKVHLILPLALNVYEPEKISIALVMTKTPSNRYRAVTIFTLDMAYSNARLVSRPLSDWLTAKRNNSL